MAIYYWHQQGRLGNLILQYWALEQITKPDDCIVCFNSKVFSTLNVDRKFIKLRSPRFVGDKCNKLTRIVSDFLTKKKVISQITPKLIQLSNGYAEESEGLKYTKGYFKNLIAIKGYFQHDQWLLDNRNTTSSQYLDASNQLKQIAKGRSIVAVHIRLTDFATWSVYGEKGTSISLSWFEQGMNIMKEKLDNPQFIVFTDDKETVCASNLVQQEVHVYEGRDEIEDFMAISLCDHAIISPSSFSYSASLMSYRKDKLIIAPKYWLGFKSNVWYPATIESEKISYLEVNQ